MLWALVYCAVVGIYTSRSRLGWTDLWGFPDLLLPLHISRGNGVGWRQNGSQAASDLKEP